MPPVWSRFPPRMRRAILTSAQIAAARGCDAVAPEHLLLAILRDAQSGGVFVLESAGLSLQAVAALLQEQAPRGDDARVQRAQRLSPAAMHVIDIAAGEADRMLHSIVGTQHVAAAFAQPSVDGIADELRQLGFTRERAQAGVQRWAEQQANAAGRPTRRPSEGARRVRVRRWLDQLPRPLRRAIKLPGIAWTVFARRSIMHPGFVRRPYRMYRWLRQRHPVRQDPLVPVWILTRYADVNLMLKDPRFHKDPFAAERLPDVIREQLGMGDDVPRQEIETVSMLFLDPPQHTRVRSLFARAFTPKMIENLRPRIQQITDKRLDAVIARGEMDVIETLAYPLPVIVIAELLGFPAEDYPLFKKWSDAFAAALGLNPSTEQQAEAETARMELHAYFDKLVPLRKGKGGDDLLSTLLDMEDEAGALSREELFINVMLLLAAGHETTTNLIANGLWSLLRHPDQLALLKREPALIESAVEELLRYEGPVQWVSRVLAEPVEIGGVKLDAGAILLGSIGAANHDPAVFEHPDTLDIRRSPNRHVAFGSGIHFCLGAALARMEGQIAIATMLRRLPNLRLAQRRVRWKKGIIFRAMRQLRVKFDPPPTAATAI